LSLFEITGLKKNLKTTFGEPASIPSGSLRNAWPAFHTLQMCIQNAG
jgi:hypothetical protein